MASASPFFSCRQPGCQGVGVPRAGRKAAAGNRRRPSCLVPQAKGRIDLDRTILRLDDLPGHGTFCHRRPEPAESPAGNAPTACQAAERLSRAGTEGFEEQVAEPQLHRRNVMQRLGDRGDGLFPETPFCLSKGVFNSLISPAAKARCSFCRQLQAHVAGDSFSPACSMSGC